MTYEIIATGSSGNAVIINGKYLIDCGVPYKLLDPHVKGLKGVLLTHIHGDHFNPATIKRLAFERPALRFGGCAWMVEPLRAAGVPDARIDLFTPGKWFFTWDSLFLSPFELTHDVPNCGYHLDDGHSRALYATDTGTMDGIKADKYDLYFLEANHTRAEIEAAVAEAQARGEYSYRVKAAQNHLSEEQALDWLAENMAPTSLWVPLHGHKGKEAVTDGRTPDVRKDDSTI